jgi:hypothetical protein
MGKTKIIMDAAEELLERQKSGKLEKFHTYEEAFRAINKLDPDARIGTMRNRCCLNSPERGVLAVKEAIADLIDSEYLNKDLSPRYGYKELQIMKAMEKLLKSGRAGRFLSISDLWEETKKSVKISLDVFRSMLSESDKSHFSPIILGLAKKLMVKGYFDLSPYDKIKNKTQSVATDTIAHIKEEFTFDGSYFKKHAKLVEIFAAETETSKKTARVKLNYPADVNAIVKEILNDGKER